MSGWCLDGLVREISAASDGQSWLPLTVNTGTERALEALVDELTAGIPNDVTFTARRDHSAV